MRRIQEAIHPQGTPFFYTNRKGRTFYLHKHETKKGKVRYLMKRTAKNALTELPEGLEMVENVNGIVSARQVSPLLINPLEISLIETMLAQYDLEDYRVTADRATITIHEPIFTLDSARDLLEFLNPPGMELDKCRMNKLEYDPQVPKQLREIICAFGLEANSTSMMPNQVDDPHFEPVLRLTLTDESKRRFDVERMDFLGDGGWLYLEGRLTLREAARIYFPHLGEESYYELF